MVSLAGGRIGKRLGNAVDLDDLVDDIGPDVMRLLSLVSLIDKSPTIDLDKVRASPRKSPAFYVQYTYARIHSLGRFGAEKASSACRSMPPTSSLLTHEREPRRAAHAPPNWLTWWRLGHRRAGAHKVTAWVSVKPACTRFHGFYHDCYVIHQLGPARPHRGPACGSSSRPGWGLAVGLDLLGVSAPESM